MKLLKYQIAKQGYGICFSFDGSPCFACTVGLEETFRHPELVVSGLDYEMSQRILTDLIGLVRQGAADMDGSLQRAGDMTVLLMAVPQTEARSRLAEAGEYYGDRPFRVYQVLWPDGEGRFPTDGTCSEETRGQQALFPCPA